jgi:hypothetical protein
MGLMKFASMIAIIIVVTVVTSLVGEYVLKPLAATDMDRPSFVGILGSV